MRVERRSFPQRDGEPPVVTVVLVSESDEESAILDLFGKTVGVDGVCSRPSAEVRLSDDVADHYVLLRGPVPDDRPFVSVEGPVRPIVGMRYEFQDALGEQWIGTLVDLRVGVSTYVKTKDKDYVSQGIFAPKWRPVA